MTAQLDIFEDYEISFLKEEMRKTKETSENVRKGVFARLNALEKELLQKYLDQQQKIDYLESLLKVDNLYKN